MKLASKKLWGNEIVLQKHLGGYAIDICHVNMPPMKSIHDFDVYILTLENVITACIPARLCQISRIIETKHRENRVLKSYTSYLSNVNDSYENNGDYM